MCKKTFYELDKIRTLKKEDIKKIVKREIKDLSDYSFNEEEILIEEATNLNKEQLYLLKEFNKKQLRKIKKYVRLRKKNIPINKISKKAYFYLDEFFINKNVLAPRKETEILVEYVLKYIEKTNKKHFNILDLCCGSGIIGLSIKKYSKKDCSVILSDISYKALKITKKNKKALNISDVIIKHSDLFKDLKTKNKFDIIVSNPPYIRKNDLLNLDEGVRKWDPKIALDGGEDGLMFYREIINNLNNYLENDGCVFFEIGFDQGNDVKALFNNTFNVEIYKDYSNNDRVVFAKRK